MVAWYPAPIGLDLPDPPFQKEKSRQVAPKVLGLEEGGGVQEEAQAPTTGVRERGGERGWLPLFLGSWPSLGPILLGLLSMEP